MGTKIKKLKMLLKEHVGKLKSNDGALGVDQVLAITAALIIVGLILIPGLKELGSDIIEQLKTWWTSLSTSIFSAV